MGMHKVALPVYIIVDRDRARGLIVQQVDAKQSIPFFTTEEAAANYVAVAEGGSPMRLSKIENEQDLLEFIQIHEDHGTTHAVFDWKQHQPFTTTIKHLRADIIGLRRKNQN